MPSRPRNPTHPDRMKTMRITFTGADDRTAVSALTALAANYPEVEFGVLLSPKRHGQPCYPDWPWIDHLRRHSDKLALAAHLCGDYSRQLLAEGQLPREIEDRLEGFRRIQVNTREPVDPGLIRAWIDKLSRRFGHPVTPILQCQGPFPADPRVHWLFDPSGGTGAEPASWPPRPATNEPIRIGYAGGIRPDNVARVLTMIRDQSPDWIDMESGVRDDHDHFDIGRCREICAKVSIEVDHGGKQPPPSPSSGSAHRHSGTGDG